MPDIKETSLMSYPHNLVGGGGSQGATKSSENRSLRRLAATLDGRPRR